MFYKNDETRSLLEQTPFGLDAYTSTWKNSNYVLISVTILNQFVYTM